MSRRSEIAKGIAQLMDAEKPSYLTAIQWRILHLRASGHSVESTANELGITPERVQFDEVTAQATVYKRIATTIDLTTAHLN